MHGAQKGAGGIPLLLFVGVMCVSLKKRVLKSRAEMYTGTEINNSCDAVKRYLTVN